MESGKWRGLSHVETEEPFLELAPCSKVSFQQTTACPDTYRHCVQDTTYSPRAEVPVYSYLEYIRRRSYSGRRNRAGSAHFLQGRRYSIAFFLPRNLILLRLTL